MTLTTFHKEQTAMAAAHSTEDRWTTIILPEGRRLDFSLKDIWRYRDLIGLFVRRDFVAGYKQTVLGPLWLLLPPLVTSIVFTFVFSGIAGISTGALPPFLFYLSGMVCWNYFAACFVGTSDSLVGNAAIFGKVYFPRLVIPIAAATASLGRFLIQFGLFLGVLAYYRLAGSATSFSIAVIALPLLIFQMALLGLGAGILISSLTTKYRDLRFVIAFGVQLWMYLTPVIYPLTQIPEAYRSLMALNPMVAIVEGFRFMVFGQGLLRLQYVCIGLAVTLCILFLGLLSFGRVEKTFVDTA